MAQFFSLGRYGRHQTYYGWDSRSGSGDFRAGCFVVAVAFLRPFLYLPEFVLGWHCILFSVRFADILGYPLDFISAGRQSTWLVVGFVFTDGSIVTVGSVFIYARRCEVI